MSVVGALRRCAPSSSGGRFGALLIALFVARGVALLCVMPPFEGWDEYQHVAYVQHLLETGEDPVLRRAVVSPRLLARLSEFPSSDAAVEQLHAHGVVNYDDYWSRVASSPSKSPAGPIPLYQAQHAWLYYRLVLPLYRMLGAETNLRTSVAGLRLLNLAFATVALGLAWRTLARVMSDHRRSAIVGLMIATSPLWLINATRVSNDALSVLLATGVIVWCLRLGGGSGASSRSPGARYPELAAFGIGVAAGLAVLAKALNLALVPFVAIVFVVQRWTGAWSSAALIRAAVVAAIGFASVTWTYFSFNLVTFGSWTPMQEAVLNREQGRGWRDLIATIPQVDWSTQWQRLWFRANLWVGGWSFLTPVRLFRKGYELTAWLCLAGWAITWLRRHGRRASIEPIGCDARALGLCVAACGSYTAALSYHMLHCRLAWNESVVNPWYGAAAMPWFFLLLTCGAMGWPGRTVKYAMPWHLLWLFTATEAAGVFGSMVRAYSGGAWGGEALRRLASLQPAWLGVPTLVVASMAWLAILVVLVAAWWSEGLPGRSPARGSADKGEMGRSVESIG